MKLLEEILKNVGPDSIKKLQHCLLLLDLHKHLYTIFRDSLYNTNSAFDYGGFRALAEAMSQSSSTTTLFSYQFTDPGTYVFYSSTNQYKKIVSIIFILFENIYIVWPC